MIETKNQTISQIHTRIKKNQVYVSENFQFLRNLQSNYIDLVIIDPGDPAPEEYIEYNDNIMEMTGYLGYLYERIVECYRVLKNTGNFLIFCPNRAKFELKLMIDKIFSKTLFQEEIIFCDNYEDENLITNFLTILHYSKSKNFTRNNFVEMSRKNEYFVYPEQKSLFMLLKLINAFSNKGDLIADFTCGSGTTLIAAKKLSRNFIGCDKNSEAVKLSRIRLNRCNR